MKKHHRAKAKLRVQLVDVSDAQGNVWSADVTMG